MGLEPTHYRLRAGYSAAELRWLERPEGLEPPTPWFEARCSVPLSYGRLMGGKRLSLRSTFSAQRIRAWYKAHPKTSIGGDGGSRTHELRLMRPASVPLAQRHLVEHVGIEPTEPIKAVGLQPTEANQ